MGRRRKRNRRHDRQSNQIHQPIEQDKSPDSSGDHSEQEHGLSTQLNSTKPDVSPPRINKNYSSRQQYDRHESRRYTLEKCTLLLVAVTLAITAYQACETKQSVDVAIAAIRQNEEFFTSDQAPFVQICAPIKPTELGPTTIQ